jgi:DNA-binding transcriptional ArsR family regulator
MSTERRQILDMLSQGKITAEEADRLLRATDDTVMDRPVPRAHLKPNRAKYLRVVVDTDSSGAPTKVNVRVPMALLYAGVKLSAVLPPEARDQLNARMRAQGVAFDLNQLKPENLEDLIDQLNDLTVDVDQEGTKVRVFCE